MRKLVSLFVLALIALSSLLSANLVLAQGSETPQIVIDACRGEDPDTTASYLGQVYRCGDVLQQDEVILSTPVPSDPAEIVSDGADSENSVELDMNQNWVPLKGAEIFAGYIPASDGFNLPLESINITDMSQDRYGSREPVGEEHGDWPPHALVTKIEVPQGNLDCANAWFDISWRLFFENECNRTVLYRISIDINTQHYDGLMHKLDRELTTDEINANYLTLGSGEEVGIFVASVYQEDTIGLVYGEEQTQVGVGCYDCLAHTAGPEGDFVPLVNVTHVGPDTEAPNAETPPGVFPFAQSDTQLQFVIEVEPRESAVVWAGQYVPTPLDELEQMRDSDPDAVVSASAASTCTVTPAGTANVNVRSTSVLLEDNSNVVRQLEVGQTETVIGYLSGWFELETDGWVSADVVLATNCETLIVDRDPDAAVG